MINEAPFKLKDSITWRLKAVMVAIAFFFLISALGVYLSSLGFFNGLRELHRTNQVLTASTYVFNNLDTSEMIVETIKTSDDLNLIEKDFNHSLVKLRDSVTKTFGRKIKGSETKRRVEAGLTLVKLYEKEVRKIIDETKKLSRPLSKENLLAIQEQILKSSTLVREAKIVLRSATMGMRQNSEIIFDRIYQDRFKPLYIAIVLSASFFLFVIIFGFNLSKKVSESVKNLIQAAYKVQSGDYSYIAPIKYQDEFGLLTNTFNNMVRSIDEGRRRLLQLQSITAEFAFALTSDEVLNITINKGFKASGASIGAIALANDEGELSFAKIEGIPEDRVHIWENYIDRILFLMEETKKKREPIFFESVVDALERYPELVDEKIPEHYSYAYLPLLIGEEVLGVCLLTYKNGKKFTQTEKDFLISIARQCAQALSRSFLYDDTQEAIRVRDEFLSIASHELKTPLTPLKLQLQLLLRQIKKDHGSFDEDKILKTMEKSDKQLSRLTWLIDDLLDVSRISSGRLRLNFEEVNLSELIKDVLSQYRDQLENTLKFIELDIEQDVLCEADRFRIEQVLVNLLTNAAKYAPGKPIKLSLKKHNDFAEIRVADQGPGVSKSDMDRIFTRFERVQNNDNIGGLGLGLYICKQIVSGHNGRIYLDSTVKKGASFVVELPLGHLESRGKSRLLKEF